VGGLQGIDVPNKVFVWLGEQVCCQVGGCQCSWECHHSRRGQDSESRCIESDGINGNGIGWVRLVTCYRVRRVEDEVLALFAGSVEVEGPDGSGFEGDSLRLKPRWAEAQMGRVRGRSSLIEGPIGPNNSLECSEDPFPFGSGCEAQTGRFRGRSS
jgi:hypothetical protein